ncbi:MAG: MBL fold metallo-hydrolase [Ferruginibacter sp.]|nr:MBL fold metallo-hydrolase [Ferruginibacter sp.]
MIILILVILLTLLLIAFMQQPKFGKTPAGDRLERIKKSPNFKAGKFQNIHLTPDLTEGVSYYAVLNEFFFHKNKRGRPAVSLPSEKTNLLTIQPGQDILVWFGHSSYFMQIDGKKILVDPVLSGSASPVKFTTRSFKGADIYTADDMPDIDYLFISHDHWDHLDYQTIKQLKPRIKKVICGLGTGQHFEHWGFNSNQVMEKDWGDEVMLDEGFEVNITTARHFSGRGLKRNTALWISFVLKTPSLKIFIGGDSAYDTHFTAIGNQYGPFDLAILECGQYDKSWKYIHMMPEEIIRAAHDLKAKQLMPVHWGKFLLGNHAWDDPIIQVAGLSKIKNQPLVTPMIGEAVNLKDLSGFTAWWENIP